MENEAQACCETEQKPEEAAVRPHAAQNRQAAIVVALEVGEESVAKRE